MFKKPFKVKSNSQLKGSDKKKLRSDLLLEFPRLTMDDLNIVLPNKETIFQLKVITHSGDIVNIYSVQKLPILFQTEEKMYPTIYMLWHVPDLVHTFTTHPQIFPILSQGADLMLPGVVVQDSTDVNAYGKLEKGDCVAVNLTANKAAIAVGVAASSSHDMFMFPKKGKCVRILHFYGDTLSTYGTKLVIPELGPVFTEEKVIEPESLQPIEDQQSSEVEAVETESNEINAESKTECSSVETPIEIQNSTESMDDLLRYCFFKCLRTTMKKVDLPLLTSNFYKLHMIPACPDGKNLDVKKSSFKKLSNFLSEMAKPGVISIESLQKGVQTISKIDYNCELVKQFVDDYSRDNEPKIAVDTSATTKFSAPEITEKYTVTAAVLPLFYKYDYKKKDALSSSTVHKVIGDYVRVNKLQNPNNKSEVLLDDVLRSATNCNDVEVLSWEKLVLHVFKQMGHAYKVELAGNDLQMGKGKLPPIDIQVGTRAGNKKVTLVSNLELYGINLAEFSRECQHGVAASTTINEIPSAKSAQLQIQGNQVTFVAKILTEKYQIPKRYLRGLENAPKKKK